MPATSLDNIGAVHIANVMANMHPVYPPAVEALPAQRLDEEFVNGLKLAKRIPEWEEMAKTASKSLRSPAAVAR